MFTDKLTLFMNVTIVMANIVIITIVTAYNRKLDVGFKARGICIGIFDSFGVTEYYL